MRTTSPTTAGNSILTFLLLALVFLVPTAAALFMSLTQKSVTQESLSGANELKEGFSAFLKSLPKLTLPSLSPILFTLALFAGACTARSLSFHLLGVWLGLAGQLYWVNFRKKVTEFIDAESLPPSAIFPLKAISVSVHVAAIVMLFLEVDQLSTYGVLLNPGALMVTTAFLALAVNIINRVRTPGRSLNSAPLEIIFNAICIAPLILTINYSLDFHAASKLVVISWHNCPSKENGFFTNGGDKISESADRSQFEGCQYFYDLEVPPLPEKKVETSWHPGFLFFEWKQTRALP